MCIHLKAHHMLGKPCVGAAAAATLSQRADIAYLAPREKVPGPVSQLPCSVLLIQRCHMPHN